MYTNVKKETFEYLLKLTVMYLVSMFSVNLTLKSITAIQFCFVKQQRIVCIITCNILSISSVKLMCNGWEKSL